MAKFDSLIWDAAEALLSEQPHLNTSKRIDRLAEFIRSTAEEWVAFEDANYEPPDPSGFEGGFAENH